MNNATFAGRLGRDAETRFTQAGDPVTGFSIAVDERRKGEKTTLWVDCSIWGERGEKVAQYLTKGTPVAVSGQVGVRTYQANGETRATLTLRVAELTLLGSASDGERQERPAGRGEERAPARDASRPAPAPQPSADEPFPDDDIPF